MTTLLARLPRVARALRRDRSGLAMMEFALTLPLVLTVGGYGVELSFLSVTNLRIYQAAANLADSASRVGTVVGTVTQVSEGDINDVFQGIRLTNDGIQLTTFGRITLSSLENVQQSYDTARVQRIHWQRCLGEKGSTAAEATAFGSHAGATTAAAGSDATVANAGVTKATGMGDPGKTPVNAPNDSGVMYVEVNYQYRPLFGTMFVSPQVIHYSQSFVVRDNRDFKQIYNPASSSSASKCDLFTKGPGGVTV